MNLSITYNTTNIATRTMLHSSLFLMAGLGLAAAAPGPYGSVQATAPIPARQTAGVQCRTEYTAVWDTEYVERETQECVTKYVPECKTVYEKKCTTVYKKVCVDQYKTEYEPYTETECSTEYKEHGEYHWQGEGNNKVWVPIPGSCKTN